MDSKTFEWQWITMISQLKRRTDVQKKMKIFLLHGIIRMPSEDIHLFAFTHALIHTHSHTHRQFYVWDRVHNLAESLFLFHLSKLFSQHWDFNKDLPFHRQEIKYSEWQIISMQIIQMSHIKSGSWFREGKVAECNHTGQKQWDSVTFSL